MVRGQKEWELRRGSGGVVVGCGGGWGGVGRDGERREEGSGEVGGGGKRRTVGTRGGEGQDLMGSTKSEKRKKKGEKRFCMHYP